MALAGDELEVHTVAGDNNSLFDARFVDALAEKMKFWITGTLAHRRVSRLSRRRVFITSFVGSLNWLVSQASKYDVASFHRCRSDITRRRRQMLNGPAPRDIGIVGNSQDNRRLARSQTDFNTL